MTYEKARDDAQQKNLEDWTRLFIEKYKDTTLTHTVFLFPGGTGSVLKRSRAEYEEGDVLDPSTFKTVWLNCYTLMGAALTLRMKRTEAGLYKEVDGHVVIASGTLRYLGLTAYDDFTEWCDDNRMQVFV